MNKRIKKKRWLEIKLAECLAREHLLMSAVTVRMTGFLNNPKKLLNYVQSSNVMHKLRIVRLSL